MGFILKYVYYTQRRLIACIRCVCVCTVYMFMLAAALDGLLHYYIIIYAAAAEAATRVER